MSKLISLRLSEENYTTLKKLAKDLDRSQNWLLNEAWKRQSHIVAGREIARRRFTDGEEMIPHRTVMKTLGKSR